MTEFLATGFEVGLRTPIRARYCATRAGTVDQAGSGIEHVPHLLGVVLPVGGAVQAAARAQLAHQQFGECRLHQAALVVALLVPGVGEVDAHFIQRAVGDFLLQHLDRVVVVELDVVGGIIGQRIEQAAYARCVHLDADVVLAGIELRGITQGRAIAEADFQHLGRAAAEGGLQVARFAVEINAETRPAFVEGALLGRGEAALAQYEAADLASAFGHGEGLGRRLGACTVKGIGHQPISPSTGEEALA